MTTTLRVVVLGLAVLLFSACGDDGSDAVAKCNDYITEICSRAVSCGEEPRLSDCEAKFHDVIDCDSAKGVSSTYDGCIVEIKTGTCEELFPAEGSGQPASCSGAITF